MTAITITIGLGELQLPGELNGTATATQLLELLPLRLLLEDFSGQEKLGRLPARLSTDGAPASSGAEPADIGYYAPSQHLVLYYAEVAAFPGIIPVGRFDAADLDLVRGLPDGTEAVVDRA